MELWLSVVDPATDSDVGADVLVAADPASAVRELADGIGSLLGRREAGEAPAQLYVGGVPVDPSLPLDSSPIRDGAQIGVGSPGGCPSLPGQGIVELRVVGGPDAGGIRRLGPGSVSVGGGRADLVRVDDPALGAAAVRVEVGPDGSVTASPGNNVTASIEGQTLAGATPWHRGHLLAVGGTLLELATPDFPDAPLKPSEDGTGLDYNRPPRIAPAEHDSSFSLPSRPKSAESRPLPWLMAIIPLVAAVVMARLFHNNMMLAFAIISPLSLVANYFNDRKQGKKSYLVQMKEFEERRAAIEADAGAAFVTELSARRQGFPDPALLASTATGPRRRLWERRPTDPDRLVLRVGTGTLPSDVAVSDPDQVEHRRRDPLLLRDVPIIIPLTEHGVVGIAGRGEEARALGRWIVAQSAVLHSPADLQIYVLTDPASGPSWAWVRWLPHSRPRDGQNTLALIGTTTDTVARRISELAAQLSTRQQAQRQAGQSTRVAFSDILVVLDGARRLRALPGLTQLLAEGPAVGIRLVCLDTDKSLLPEECTAISVLDHTGRVLVDRSGHRPVVDVRPDGVSVQWCERVARALTPLRDVSKDDESTLPDSCRLLDVLGMEPPDGQAIAAGWRAGGRSTQAVIGVSLDGPFALDLEKNGPHGLIAGTTGSGKSELLQSLVASLAVVNRPDAMTFVLIDYKGGSAFKECVRLPHTVGMVTDLDAHLVGRALESLAAELRRREHIFAGAGVAVPNLNAYVDARRRDPSLPALPRLLIMIDEFASLARELPDFVTGLVNVAQRGRSLGIHLILATQRPSGVVSADIRANTNLRIALRVTDSAESADVIDAPDAARVPKSTPGRAYVRLEHSSLLPFQAGRVGGRRRGEAATSAPPWVVALGRDQIGMPPPARPAAAGSAPGEDMVTDLGVLVEAIREANASLGIAPQHSPWLPALPTKLTLDGLAGELPAGAGPRDGGPAVPGVLRPAAFALLDVPGEQTRRVEAVDLATFSHLFVAGAPRSGRSQVLRTLAGSLALENSAADVHLFGLDCGNGALLALSSLPHCGAVVRSTDGERAERLIGKLTTEMAARMNSLGERGFSDVNEQRAAAAAPAERLPHLVLLIDRWEGFLASLGERDNGALTEAVFRLLREGASAGIHVVISGDHTLLGGRIAPLTENKLALRLSDPADFALIGIPARSVPVDLPSGRVYKAGTRLQAQILLLADDPAGAAQAAALERVGVAATERDADVPAALRPFGVDVLPSRIGFDAAWALRVGRPGPLWGMVAVGGDRLTALGPDLASGTPAFVIGGPPESGRSTALLALAVSYLTAGTEIVVVTPRSSPLRSLAGSSGVRGVITGHDLSGEELRAALAPGGPVVVLIDDAEMLRECGAGAELTALVRRQYGEDVGLVLAGDSDSVCSGFSGWQVEAKKARRGLLLSPQNVTDAELIGARLPRAVLGRPITPGSGVLHLGGGELVAVQVPLADVSL